MSKSIAVFGVGPGVGQAIARRYGQSGFEPVLVARRREPLEAFARELSAEGITAHVVGADLSRTDLAPALAAEIRTRVGDPTVVYYGPTPGGPGFTRAADLSVEPIRDLMPITLYTLIALVREFLPAMLEQGDGAVLSAQGASALEGRPGMSGWAPALAAQRSYLQSLAGEVAGSGVHVGMLYIGARILGSAWDARMREAEAAGEPVPAMHEADPAELAESLWQAHADRKPHEIVFPPAPWRPSGDLSDVRGARPWAPSADHRY